MGYNRHFVGIHESRFLEDYTAFLRVPSVATGKKMNSSLEKLNSIIKNTDRLKELINAADKRHKEFPLDHPQ